MPSKSALFKAIKEKCLDCSAGSKADVRLCPCQNCALFPYRFGKNSKLPSLDTFDKKSLDNKPVLPIENETNSPIKNPEVDNAENS